MLIAAIVGVSALVILIIAVIIYVLIKKGYIKIFDRSQRATKSEESTRMMDSSSSIDRQSSSQRQSN